MAKIKLLVGKFGKYVLAYLFIIFYTALAVVIGCNYQMVPDILENIIYAGLFN